jgi:hypothetical protein
MKRPEIWVPVIYVVSVVVLSTLVAVFLIFPSNAEKGERECASLGMEYVGFGMCQMPEDR